MAKALYQLSICAYTLAIRLAAPFNTKAKAWIQGRKESGLEKASLAPKSRTRIWFHISSLGEYEQAKPLLNTLKESHELVITFFSPSGYTANKAQQFTEHVYYLPVDKAANMRACMQKVQADALVLVKYDFWYHLIKEANRAGIPVLATSVLLRAEQIYFRSYGRFFLNILKRIDHFCVQNEETAQLLKQHGIADSTICGDTRVDSVVLSQGEKKLPSLVSDFVKGHKCLVAGSTYAIEEQLLHKAIEHKALTDWKILLAPHQVHQEHIEQIAELFGNKAVRLSQATTIADDVQVLIIDSIGLLMHLYSLADMALVGGGFGKTVHNTLEPAAYGLPLLYGPNYSKFTEAVAFVETGAATVLSESTLPIKALELFENEEARKRAGRSAKAYIDQNTGASPKTVQELEKLLRRTA